MPESSASEVTQLLLAWSAGDRSASEKLSPIVRQEPHRLAKIYMSRERSGHIQNVPTERGAGQVALDEALRAPAEIDPRRSRIVELRFFGGLNVEETTEAIRISRRTVTRVELGQGMALPRTHRRTQR